MTLNLDNDAPAPADRQYIAVRFKAGGRTYTYHNDGPPVAIGDQVAVPAFRGDGWQRAEVVELVDQAPTFATKSIDVAQGVIPPEPAAG